MTEKEFHKMRPSDLVQLLLAQGVESAKMQEALDKKREQLDTLHQENDALKEKLNDRDAATDRLKMELDQSDASIRELEEEMESLQADQWIDLKEAGALTEAAQKLNTIFEAAQKEAEAYLSGEKPVEASLMKKIKKAEKKPLKSRGKYTDKENRSKELVEATLPRPEIEDTQNMPDVEELASDIQLPVLQEANAPHDVWPDEIPGHPTAGHVLQEPWPDEIAAGNGASQGETAQEEEAPKRLLGSLTFWKKQPKRGKDKKKAKKKDSLQKTGQSPGIPQ